METIRILFLEDSEEDTEIIQYTLRKAGLKFESSRVDNRLDFINSLYSFSPDIIISDHALPQFNSMQALGIVKKVMPGLPFILVTGSVSEEFAVQSLRTGADDYILKGSLLRLPEAVKTVMARKAAVREINDVRQLNKQLSNAYEALELAHSEIKGSIHYARTIQSAMLPGKDILKNNFPASFILYLPKDIVSGDFYWICEKENKIFIAAADCTGHGVPGALMSILGSSSLNNIIHEENINRPADILEALDKAIRNNLGKKQEEEMSETRDGMDIAICLVNKETCEIEFAGANRPFVFFRNKELQLIKGNRRSIGGHNFITDAFENHRISLKRGDRFYLFTDGYADQLGGYMGKKMMTKVLLQMLSQLQEEPVLQHKDEMCKALMKWKGEQDQTDDVLIIGIEL